jgi:hypothetical protein
MGRILKRCLFLFQACNFLGLLLNHDIQVLLDAAKRVKVVSASLERRTCNNSSKREEVYS